MPPGVWPSSRPPSTAGPTTGRSSRPESTSRPAACSPAPRASRRRPRRDVYGGTAGQQYDPCYHAACDTFSNNNDAVLDLNADAIAAATLTYAMSTQTVNGG